MFEGINPGQRTRPALVHSSSSLCLRGQRRRHRISLRNARRRSLVQASDGRALLPCAGEGAREDAMPARGRRPGGRASSAARFCSAVASSSLFAFTRACREERRHQSATLVHHGTRRHRRRCDADGVAQYTSCAAQQQVVQTSGPPHHHKHYHGARLRHRQRRLAVAHARRRLVRGVSQRRLRAMRACDRRATLEAQPQQQRSRSNAGRAMTSGRHLARRRSSGQRKAPRAAEPRLLRVRTRARLRGKMRCSGGRRGRWVGGRLPRRAPRSIA